MTLSRLLSDFASGLQFAQLPAEVVSAAKLHLLDTVGTALAGHDMPYAQAMLDVVQTQGTSVEATLLATQSARASAAWAGAYNAALSHAHDFDDTHSVTLMHISSVVAPAAIAVAESRRASGAQTLTAIAAGYETGLRIGMAVPARLNVRGFHATSVIGVFAAAITASRLIGLDASRTMHAIGIAGSQASGLIEFLAPDGAWTKRLQPGWAVHGGIIAAQLAERGFTGPQTILEGRFGALRSFGGVEPPSAAEFAGGLGERWETLNIAFKPYPCCHIGHAYVDCALALRSEHAIEFGDIESIELRVASGMVPILCEPRAQKARPQTAYSSQFSLPYMVAAAMRFGRLGVDEFAERNIRDEALLALVARIGYVVDDGLPYPEQFPGCLKIRLRDGRVLERHRDASRGSPGSPMTEAELRDKFLANVARAIPMERARQAWEIGMRLEQLPDLSEFNQLLARC
ncbi:MAG: MmgE/PrpD family protein [Burkholderiaceae bacterium]